MLLEDHQVSENAKTERRKVNKNRSFTRDDDDNA